MRKYCCIRAHEKAKPTKVNPTGFNSFVVGKEYSFETPPSKKYFRELLDVGVKYKPVKQKGVKNG